MTASERGFLALGCALTVAVAINFRQFQVLQIALVAIAAAVAVLAATWRTSTSRLSAISDAATPHFVLALGAGIVFLFHANRYFPRLDSVVGVVVATAPLVVVLLGLAFVLGWGGKYVWPLFLLIYAFLLVAVVVVTAADAPILDVAVFQRDGIAALLDGVSPYSITFPDIYSAEESRLFYADGLAIDGVLHFGYPYFPLGLVLAVPFELIGDHRLAQATAVLASAVLIERLSTTRMARTAAVVFVFASPALAIVRLGWMDPLVVAAIGFTVWVSKQRSTMASAASGLLFALKQYTAFLLLPTLLLLDRPWTVKAVVRHFSFAAAVFLLVTLPFVVWDFGGFWWSTIELQLVQPFRPDSTAIPALFGGVWSDLPPLLTVGGPILIVVGISVLLLVQTPTGGQGFALASGAVLLVGFVTSKQAFANYYLVVVGALCVAAAARDQVSANADQAHEVDWARGSDSSLS